MAKRRPREPVTNAVGFPLHTAHLADTSAWSKAHNDQAMAASFDDAVRAGLIATCDLVALELLRSARNPPRFAHQAKLLHNLRDCPIGAAHVKRARKVQTALASAGNLRGVKPADLLIAAAAEAAALPVLHYDHDYDLITSVTNQPMRWLSARGSRR